MFVVSGELLNQNVTPDRSRVNLPSAAEAEIAMATEGLPTLERVLCLVEESVQGMYHQSLLDLRAEGLARVDGWVSVHAPQYRSLVRRFPDELAYLEPADGDKLREVLAALSERYAGQIRSAAQRAIRQDANKDAVEESVRQLVEQAGDLAQSELLSVAMNRAVALKLFSRLIMRTDEGDTQFEGDVHDFLYHRKASEGSVDPGASNLWMIDERLEHHRSLSSDVRMRDRDSAIAVESSDRPDLLAVVDNTLAFIEGSLSNPISVVLVELKRPQRDDLDKRNPVDQMLQYVESLKTGQYRDARKGRVQVPDGTVFLGYIIADMSPQLEKLFRHRSFQKLPAGQGWLWYNESVGVLIRAMTYRAVLEQAWCRNEAYLSKCGVSLEFLEDWGLAPVGEGANGAPDAG